MKLLLRYIFEFFKEKKSRTFLLIFAICISGAMIYTMLDAKENLEDIYREKLTFELGDSDIFIIPDKDKEERKVEISIDFLKEDLEYIHRVVETTAIYKYSENKNKVLQLYGTTIADFEETYQLEFAQDSNPIEELSEDGIMISSKTAEKFGLSIDDEMTFAYGPFEKVFRIEAIAAPMGLFLDETQNIKAVVSFETLSDFIMLDGSANKVMLGLKDKENKEAVMEELLNRYPDYIVKESIDQDKIDEEMSTLSMTLLFSAIMGSFMSLFIIYSSFKVIVTEQIPQIGTFRSIGATKGTVNRLIVLQGLLYGGFGGIAGTMLGTGISYAITRFSVPNNMKDIIQIKYGINAKYMIISFVCSAVISLIGTMAPIASVSKIPIKNIVLNLIDTDKSISIKRRLLYLPLFILAILFPHVAKGSMAGPLSVLFTVISYITVIGLIPVFLKIIAEFLKWIMQLLFGNIGKLSHINISTSKSALSSTTLMTIGISIIIFMIVLSNGLTKVLVGAVEDIQTYDISISGRELGKDQRTILNETKEVKDYLFGYCIPDVEIKDSDRTITLIEGVEDRDYLKYRNISLDDTKWIDDLQEGNKIILTDTLKSRMDLNVGDEITLVMNDKEKTFEIIAFSDTYMTAGSFGMISMTDVHEIMDDDGYNSIYVNVKPEESVKEVSELLEVKFNDQYMNFEIVEEFVDNFKGSMQQITVIIQCFAVLAVVIGFIGIVNNLLLNYLERQHEFAIFRSVGMSVKQMIEMLFAESLIVGLAGGVVGVICGILQLNILPVTLQMVNVNLPLDITYKTCLIFIICAVTISVFATVTVAVKSSKLSIVEGIK